MWYFTRRDASTPSMIQDQLITITTITTRNQNFHVWIFYSSSFFLYSSIQNGNWGVLEKWERSTINSRERPNSGVLSARELTSSISVVSGIQGRDRHTGNIAAIQTKFGSRNSLLYGQQVTIHGREVTNARVTIGSKPPFSSPWQHPIKVHCSLTFGIAAILPC